ncbi:acyl carrier protein (plasmid) [Agrobacterium leguminum]|uniref:acyl carrier protein n=1 Tax=Agrobacterium TaxID=357 RepID=UPI001E39FA1B|nr:MULTISPECIES: acyl carrier protein [Agrobacterium]WFS70001.1 acyl carrier protein [Agrobacterium leguminum]
MQSELGHTCDTGRSQHSMKWPADETPLLEGGIIDTLGFLDLMTFLSERFDIGLDDTHFEPDNQHPGCAGAFCRGPCAMVVTDTRSIACTTVARIARQVSSEDLEIRRMWAASFGK